MMTSTCRLFPVDDDVRADVVGIRWTPPIAGPLGGATSSALLVAYQATSMSPLALGVARSLEHWSPQVLSATDLVRARRALATHVDVRVGAAIEGTDITFIDDTMSWCQWSNRGTSSKLPVIVPATLATAIEVAFKAYTADGRWPRQVDYCPVPRSWLAPAHVSSLADVLARPRT